MTNELAREALQSEEEAHSEAAANMGRQIGACSN